MVRRLPVVDQVTFGFDTPAPRAYTGQHVWKSTHADQKFVAFSGGADSTALALRLSEIGEPFSLLHTPTGNELPEVADHVARIVDMTGAKLVLPPAPTLEQLIDQMGGLPNGRMRWCTRMIKVKPCIAYLKRLTGTSILYVGLRADEDSREGLYDKMIVVERPLAKWGWDRQAVVQYNRRRGVSVPARTDCAVCFYQRLAEWYSLWKNYPEQWKQGEAWEEKTGYTFRRPLRHGSKAFPAAMKDMRARFESGVIPRGVDEDEDSEPACRVCTM